MKFSSLVSIDDCRSHRVIVCKHETRSTLHWIIFYCWWLSGCWHDILQYFFVLHFSQTFFTKLVGSSYSILTYPMRGLEPARSWLFVQVIVTLLSVTLMTRGVPGMDGNVLASGVRCKFTLPLFSTYLRRMDKRNHHQFINKIIEEKCMFICKKHVTHKKLFSIASVNLFQFKHPTFVHL